MLKVLLICAFFLDHHNGKNTCQTIPLFKKNERHKENKCPTPIMRSESPQLLELEVELVIELSPDQLNFSQRADVWMIVNVHRLKALRFGWFVMQQ